MSRHILLLMIVCISVVAHAQETFFLSDDEQQLLSEYPDTMLRGADSAWPPFEFRQKDGVYAGICQDYTDIVAKRLSLEIKLIPDLVWDDVLNKIMNKDLDVITCLAQTQERDAYLSFTAPFTSIPQVIFTQPDYPYVGGLKDLNNKRVAMTKGYAVTDILKRQYPKLDVVMADNPFDALKLVSTGQADAFVGTLAVGIYLIRKYNLANLKVAAPAEVPALEMRFGFRKDWESLVPLIDKVLASITTEEHTAIQQRWINVEYDPLVDYSLLWKVGSTLSVLLILAVLWISQVQRQKRALQESESKLITQRNALQKLTEVLEAYGERVGRELDMARETQRVLLPDLDKVKTISDIHVLHIDSRFEPSSELGGDFWKLDSIDENRVAVLMVDFVGHGINAALNTFRLHALLESEATTNTEPAVFLENLNNRLSPLLPSGQYATMFYGVIDRNLDILTYAGAATPNPLIFMPGEDEPLIGIGEGLPIGMFDGSTYEDREIPFPKGSSILLYSDAVTEGKTKSGVRLEEKGLVELTKTCLQSCPRENLIELLAKELDELLEQPLADDLTIIHINRLLS
ncbi:MAG: transporter substrate-binding domain-containing protein [Gammaproteobacteria bacterium]